jgi:hypothetical protein
MTLYERTHCIVRGCDEPRAKDSDRCEPHRWQQWTGPEWRRRAAAKDLSGAIYSTGKAA